MPENFTPSSKREILRVFFTRWLGIFTIFVIVFGSTVAATVMAPKWYRSRIGFESQRPRPINPLASPQNPFLPTEVFLRKQQALILSEDVVSRALARLDLGDKAKESAVSVAAENIRKTQQQRLRRQTKRIKITTPVGENLSNSEVFFINVDFADDPKMAQKLTTTIAKEYRKKFNSLEKQALSKSTTILQGELGEVRKGLDAANQALARFIRDDLGGNFIAFRSITSAATPLSVAGVAASFDKEAKILQADLSEKSALKTELDKEFARVAKLSDLGPLDTSNIPVIPERLLKDNPPVLALAEKLTELRLKAIELEPRYTPNFRQRKDIAQEIRNTSKLLVDNLSRIRTALGQDITASEARLGKLKEILRDDQDYMKLLSTKYVAYQRLNKNIESANRDYKAKDGELKRAKTAESIAEQSIFLRQIDSEASLPDEPISPILWINATVGGIVGLLLALAYAFIADYLDHRFKSVEEAERYLDLPVLASVQNLGRRIIVRR